MILFLLLSVHLAFANHLSLKDGAHRFNLDIKRTDLHFSSEILSRSISVTACNRHLISSLNSELLRQIQTGSGIGKGILFLDGNRVSFPEYGQLHRLLLGMDIRMVAFFQQVKQTCRE